MVGYACVLLSLAVSGTFAGTNFTILTLPVNTTSWKLYFQDLLNGSLSRSLDGLENVVDFVKKGSIIDCTPEGEQCSTEVPSCCPAGKDDEVDLECLPYNKTYFCRRTNDSEELAQLRLDSLEATENKGMFASHPWAYSWEFESRSAAEREEELAAEEAEFKKNFKPSNVDNIWVRIYKMTKNKGYKIWHNMRKMKKLKEIRASMIEKYRKRMSKKKHTIVEPQSNLEEEPGTKSSIYYPEEVSENRDEAQGKTNSDESVIKFSDEIPKKENKIDFRIDDVIKDAVKVVDKKFKKRVSSKTRDRKDKPLRIPFPSSAEKPFHLNEIEDTEDKLMKEINELKNLRARKQKNVHKYKENEPDIEDMIKRQVATILEEERRLDKLRKLQELKRIEGKQGKVIF